jgi:hypothetical protein
LLQKKQNNAKANGKATKALVEKKIAEHVEHMKRGVGIDPVLVKQDLDTLALAIVEKIKLIVPEGHNFYTFVCRKYRVDDEAFASVSGQGGQQRLIQDANGGNVTAKDMNEKYGWVVVKDLYTSTCVINVNELEKRVHVRMHADPRSIWLQNGMGGVRLEEDKDGNIINVLTFSLNIIHGPRKDLTFAAAKRHKSKLSDVFAVAAPRAVKRKVSDEEYDLRKTEL